MYENISRIWDLDVLVLLIPVPRVVYYHTPWVKPISKIGRDLVWAGSARQEHRLGSTIRLHRLCLVTKECAPKENTVSLAIGQFRMTGTQPQTLDAEKQIVAAFTCSTQKRSRGFCGKNATN